MCDSKTGWTVDTLHDHFTVLREGDTRFYEERDRRYTSESELRAMALRIKETADAEALRLAREAQSLKDEQTDKLRDESLSRSGIYATNAGVQQAFQELEARIQEVLKPLVDYVSNQKGATGAAAAISSKHLTQAGLLIAVGVALMKFIGG